MNVTGPDANEQGNSERNPGEAVGHGCKPAAISFRFTDPGLQRTHDDRTTDHCVGIDVYKRHDQVAVPDNEGEVTELSCRVTYK